MIMDYFEFETLVEDEGNDKYLILIIYDISDNKVRNNIVRIAREYGLYRVQKSVFFGNINNNKMDEIILESKKVINFQADSVYIFPMCEKDFKKAKKTNGWKILKNMLKLQIL